MICVEQVRGTMTTGDHKYIQHTCICQKIRREETRLKSRWEEMKMYLTECGIDQTDTGNIPRTDFIDRGSYHKGVGFLKHMNNHQVFTPPKTCPVELVSSVKHGDSSSILLADCKGNEDRRCATDVNLA